jgi:hypothetical protein
MGDSSWREQDGRCNRSSKREAGGNGTLLKPVRYGTVPLEDRCDNQFVPNKSEGDEFFDAVLARIVEEMAEPRMASSVREALGTSKIANHLFQPKDHVYNRDTKEHGVVNRVYERDGVVMYEVWVPATRYALQWGHFLSDWPENALDQ